MSGEQAVRSAVVAEHVTRRVNLIVEGAEPLRKLYGSKSYRPERVSISYFRPNAEPWQLGTVEVSGPFVKKDGSDAADSSTDKWWGPLFKGDSAPAWLRELVELHHPDRVE